MITVNERGELCTVNDKIKELLHGAKFAQSQYVFASKNGYLSMARDYQDRSLALINYASTVYLDNPGSVWPDCDFMAPEVP